MSGAVFALDSHVDLRWPDPPDPRLDGPMRVDFPKMERGGLRGVVFIAYVPQGRRDEAGHAGAAARAEAMLRHIRERADGEARRFCATAAEVEAVAASGALAVLSAVENGYAMGGDLGAVARWRALGACYLTLTHDGHNDLADSARPKPALGDAEAEHGGLSALGRDAVGALNRAGMMVDVSHVSKAGMLQAAEISRSPVVATHTACRALRDHPRCIDDEQLDALQRVGGLAQITAVSAFLRAFPPGTPAAEASVEDMADHVDHAVRRIGVEHVGVSSDFDGGGGLKGWENAAETGGLTAALRGRGYGAREIGLLWSGNFLRVMRAAEAVAN